MKGTQNYENCQFFNQIWFFSSSVLQWDWDPESGSGLKFSLTSWWDRDQIGIEVENLVGTGTGSGFDRDSECFYIMYNLSVVENYYVKISQ